MGRFSFITVTIVTLCIAPPACHSQETPDKTLDKIASEKFAAQTPGKQVKSGISSVENSTPRVLSPEEVEAKDPSRSPEDIDSGSGTLGPEEVYTEDPSHSPADIDPGSGVLPPEEVFAENKVIAPEDFEALVVDSIDSKEVSLTDVDFVPLGIPYKARRYPTEKAAAQDAPNRPLGLPYAIQTELQENAEKQGY